MGDERQEWKMRDRVGDERETVRDTSERPWDRDMSVERKRATTTF